MIIIGLILAYLVVGLCVAIFSIREGNLVASNHPEFNVLAMILLWLPVGLATIIFTICKLIVAAPGQFARFLIRTFQGTKKIRK